MVDCISRGFRSSSWSNSAPSGRFSPGFRRQVPKTVHVLPGLRRQVGCNVMVFLLQQKLSHLEIRPTQVHILLGRGLNFALRMRRWTQRRPAHILILHFLLPNRPYTQPAYTQPA